MNEAEWLAERHCSQGMLWPLQDTVKAARTKAGRRKCRLFACGCSRLLWEHLHDPRLRQAVEVAQRHADGLASKQELAQAREGIRGLLAGMYDSQSTRPTQRTAAWLASSTTEERAFSAMLKVTAIPVPLGGGYKEHQAVDEAILCELLRCVFGNPFRPVAIAPGWKSANDRAAAKIAQSIYDERAFNRLPLLADALEDAGCDNPDVLAHCRGGGRHIPGCWVVDAILGKG